jgi:alpha-beta hydrolase superfamily lysophospholipase
MPSSSGVESKSAVKLKSRHRIWRWAALLAAAVLLFYAVIGYLATASLIGENPRWRGMNRGPADFGLKGETVSLRSTDGIALKAWWLPADGNPRGTVIIAHGVDHTRQVMLPRAAFLVHGGYNVLALDLRGHGESAAQYVSPGYLEARDVLGGIRYVRSRGVSGPIALLGVSYGAAASLLAAAQSSNVAAVVADGPYPNAKAVWKNINRHFIHDPKTPPWMRAACVVASAPGIPAASMLVYYLRTGVYLGPDWVSVVSAAPQIHVPVLLISGSSDWIVPTAQVRQVQAALASSRKPLLIIPGAQHDTTFSTAPALYSQSVLSFLDSNLDK